MSVDGLRCILYARIYILYMRAILYYCIQTGRPPVPISSELKLKTNSWLAQYLSNLFLKELTESASTTCNDDSWRDTFFGKHEYDAVTTFTYLL